mmetsp:Transcript_35143/g.78837  ORF Transcript_35143/g.78837 Transcript_35143/m.78837 type:complete len:241 (+) Transcript_35143:1-723(+)
MSFVPRLFPATQLLLSFELQRAHERFSTVPRGAEVNFGEGRQILEDALRPVSEGMNALPSFLLPQASIGALVVCDEVAIGTGIPQVEVALIESVTSRPGWTAPFLLRSDERSEVVARLLDLEVRTGRLRVRHERGPVTLCPANFVCQIFLNREGRMLRIDEEGLERFQAMRETIVRLLEKRQRLQCETCKRTQAPCDEAGRKPSSALANVTNLPSEERLSNKVVLADEKDVKENKIVAQI